jgi:large subunit ribosomal protein L20
MPRVKSNVARLKRKNKVMKLAKGYWGGRKQAWKAAKEATERAAKYAYRDRRSKKVEFRRL